MNNTITRRIATILTGSALAAGILAGSLGAGALAQANPPSEPGQCAMAMPTNPAPSANAPSVMTRAGMIGQNSATVPGKNSSMDLACSAS